MKRKSGIPELLISIAVSEGAGALSALLSGAGMNYETLNKPPLSPPGWVFGVVWPILYLLMAVAAWLVYRSDASQKEKQSALLLYVLQLTANFLWSIAYFGLDLRLFAFFWLLLLIFLVVETTRAFSRINRTAGLLMIPYLLWLSFAAYLNLGTWWLNR